MQRATVLTLVPCDVKRLPLGTVEAFLLSHVDGRSTLEEIAEIAGLSFAEAMRLASRLVELGAIAAADGGKTSKAPPSRRRTHKSLRAPADDDYDIDETARAKILDLDARLDLLDHYALLGASRDSDKKTIKRAYFALASTFHPDRYFGKKLGKARVPLERIFTRITLAHDTLVDKERRAEYDAHLPPPPPRTTMPELHLVAPEIRLSKPPPRTSKPPRASKPPPRTSKPPPRVSKPPPRVSKPPPRVSKPPPRTSKPPPRVSKPPPRTSKPPVHGVRVTKPPPRTSKPPPARASKPVVVVHKPPESARRKSSRAMRQVDAGLRDVLASGQKKNEVQRRVEIFVRAAEDAMKKDDVISAANNLRLALENSNDPQLRSRLEAIEGKAKERMFSNSVARARQAERMERWDDAAVYYRKAFAARDEGWCAERAANAMRRAGVDLRQAAQLAERAVAADPQNASYRITLGEIYLEAKMFARAAGEASRALAIAPTDKRAKALAAAAARGRG